MVGFLFFCGFGVCLSLATNHTAPCWFFKQTFVVCKIVLNQRSCFEEHFQEPQRNYFYKAAMLFFTSSPKA